MIRSHEFTLDAVEAARTGRGVAVVSIASNASTIPYTDENLLVQASRSSTSTITKLITSYDSGKSDDEYPQPPPTTSNQRSSTMLNWPSMQNRLSQTILNQLVSTTQDVFQTATQIHPQSLEENRHRRTTLVGNGNNSSKTSPQLGNLNKRR